MRESLDTSPHGAQGASNDSEAISAIIAEMNPFDNSRDFVGIIAEYPNAAEAVFSDPKLCELCELHFEDGTPERTIFRATHQLYETNGAPAPASEIETQLTHLARTDKSAALAVQDFADICGGLHHAITKENASTIAQAVAKSILADGYKVSYNRSTRRFIFSKLGQILLQTDPDYLVHRLLTEGGTSLLTARHKSFKSFIALDLALCIATGRLWHGYEVKQGPVVYVAAEGAAGLKKRAAAWLAHHKQVTPDNFIVLNMPFRVHEPLHRADFIKELGDLKPSFIVIDTLARCAIGLDENNAGDMGTFADAIGDLARETGAHVMIVHHNNKGGEYRGSSAVPAAVDTHVSMERRGDTVTMKTEKQKDDEELPDLLFEKIVVPIPNTNGEKHSLVFHRLNTRSGGRGALSDIEQKTLDALVETYGAEIVNSTQWKKAAGEEKGMPESSFQKARRGLVEKKAVLRVAGVENGKGKDSPRYQIAPEWAPPSVSIPDAGEMKEEAPSS